MYKCIFLERKLCEKYNGDIIFFKPKITKNMFLSFFFQNRVQKIEI